MNLVPQRRGQRALGRLFTLAVITLVAVFLRVVGAPQATPTMLLGLLLLGAFVAGELSRELHFPRITGYILAGIALGPHALAILEYEVVESFKLIDEIALAIIAMQAGGELRIDRVRARAKGIGMILLFQVILISTGVVGVTLLARDMMPFLVGEPFRAVLAVGMIFGLAAVATSPAATVAVITESRARGPVSETVLGVSVLKDVAILLLIAAVLPAAAALVDPAIRFDFLELRHISVVVAVSLAIGAAIGWLLSRLIRRSGRYTVLLVLAVALLIVEASHMFGLEHILVSLGAGFVVQNATPEGESFIEALEANSLPLYALFFALAGASVNLAAVPGLWEIMALLVGARAALIVASTWLGAVSVGEPPVVRRYAWLGFTSQAGVTLGVASMVRDQLGALGIHVASIIIAIIAVHELVGPPLFRLAIEASGEHVPEKAGKSGSALAEAG